MSGAAAILATIGIVAFVQLRRRRARLTRPFLSFSTGSVNVGPQTKVTPFDPNSFEATQDLEISTDQQPLVTEDPEAEIVALHILPTQPTIHPRSRPVAPIPAGLSSKEIARLRAEALSSQQFHSRSTSNASRSTSSPDTIESSSGTTAPYNNQRLHTEVESLVRQEMERLRTRGLVLEAPPSYTEGDR